MDLKFLSNEELKKRMTDLCESKSECEREIEQISKLFFKEGVEKWKPFVGQCFKFSEHGKDYIFVITDIPQEEITMMYVTYNRHRLPVFLFNCSTGISRQSTITSFAIDSDDVYKEFCKKYKPISQEDFLIEIEDVITKNIINQAVERYIND